MLKWFKKLKHNYLISYHFSCKNSGASGYGSQDIFCSKPLSLKDLDEVKLLIENNIKIKHIEVNPHAVILNIIKMKR